MEILALLGTPKVLADGGSLGRVALMSVGRVSSGTATTPENAPGISFDISDILNGTSGFFTHIFRLTFNANITQIGPTLYTRIVYGFRIVFTGGFRGDTSCMPTINLIAGRKDISQNITTTVPVPLRGHLTSSEGQYIEVEVDYEAATVSHYVDGVYVGSAAWQSPDGLSQEKPFMVEPQFDQTNLDRAPWAITGHYRDLYIGGLAPGEVFEPLGDLTVENLPVASHTLVGTVTPVAIDTWAQPFANLSTLDTAGVAVRTQSYGDVTPLKSAVAITGWCPSLTGTAYMEAASGGSKINGETKFLGNRFNPHLMRIKPADIANDLVISMKIDP